MQLPWTTDVLGLVCDVGLLRVIFEMDVSIAGGAVQRLSL
jgi:hypothetical protein